MASTELPSRWPRIRQIPDKQARQRAAAPHRVYATARVVLQTPELIQSILASLIDSDSIQQQRVALALAARVCKVWSKESALLLWRLAGRLDCVRRHVCISKQAVIASYMRRACLFDGDDLWADMPSFPNIRDIYIVSNSEDFSSLTVHFPKLVLSSRVQELKVEIMPDYLIDPTANYYTPSPMTDLPWLRAVEQRCANLTILELNLRLPASAITDLGRLLLSTSLKKLYFGPLLDEILDDFTVALVLAQQSIQILMIDYPITLEALKILSQQCNGRQMLKQLYHLQIHCTVDAAEVLTLLLPLTPHLDFFRLTLYPSKTDMWVLPTECFEALARLSDLSHLSISFQCAENEDVAIGGTDLLALAEMPGLLTLNFEHYLPKSENMLPIRDISTAELIHLMRRLRLFWSPSTLNLEVEHLTCTMAQAHIVYQLYSTIANLNFTIGGFTIVEELVIPPEAWLPSNSNFAPDPMEWEYRPLYNPEAQVGSAKAVKDDDQDDNLVWGDEEPKHKRCD
ncbi:hypothetical protein KCU65_g5739, partial [Aureobasidium melanogenum]